MTIVNNRIDLTPELYDIYISIVVVIGLEVGKKSPNLILTLLRL